MKLAPADLAVDVLLPIGPGKQGSASPMVARELGGTAMFDATNSFRSGKYL
jgi:hypothetical protein